MMFTFCIYLLNHTVQEMCKRGIILKRKDLVTLKIYFLECKIAGLISSSQLIPIIKHS